MGRIYLDWNATTPLRAEARAAMITAMDLVGNPSSVHAEGRAAKSIVEKARRQVARAFGADGAEVIFTSSATEAAALALAGIRGSNNFPSPIEHECVLSWYQAREGDGSEPLAAHLKDWRFNPDGSLTATFGPELYQACILGEGILSVTAANSETGIVNNVLDFAAETMRTTVSAAQTDDAQMPNHRLLVDATQAFGKIPFAFNWSGADMAIISAHKLGGPKGVGALVVKRGTNLAARIIGGGQEMGRRAGTENVIGIAGFGAAAQAAALDLEGDTWSRVEKLRNILEKHIAHFEKETIFVGNDANRLPNTSCFMTPGWKGETQVMVMDLAGFAISAGSACSSGKVKASKVLSAMGFSDAESGCAIRVSLGPTTTEDEVRRFADAWIKECKKWRERAR